MTESSLTRPIQVLWAVDPFARDAEIQKNAGWALKSLLRFQNVNVEPVYVATDPRHEIAPLEREPFLRRVRAEAQDELDEWVAGLRIKGLQELRVLGPRTSSMRDQVEALLTYAEERGASLLAASTRARKGPSRWFFGSFVETLSLLSPIPLLSVNPSWTPRGNPRESSRESSPEHVRELPIHFENILFPTDFTDNSHDALQRLLPFAQAMKIRITLFHKILSGPMVLPDIVTSSIEITTRAEKTQIEKARDKLSEWTRELKIAGFEVEPVLDSRRGESITRSILRQSRRTLGVIALAGDSRTGHTGISHEIETRLLGSIPRQLLRESGCPVWIFRSNRRRTRPAVLPHTA